VSERRELPPRLYAISPEPSGAERLAIVAALERLAEEDEARSQWSALARREAVDDRLR
jgi:hypothetical protein